MGLIVMVIKGATEMVGVKDEERADVKVEVAMAGEGNEVEEGVGKEGETERGLKG